MVGNVFKYNHPVTVSTESGELLGSGHFVGEVDIDSQTGEPKWGGNLYSNIDTVILVEAGTLSLEFDNGVTARALCSRSIINVTRSGTRLNQLTYQVTLSGQGEPPRVDR